MATWKIVILTVAAIAIIAGLGFGFYRQWTQPSTLDAIGIAILPEWKKMFGDSDQSRRDYNTWLIVQTVNKQAKRIDALEDPNEVVE